MAVVALNEGYSGPMRDSVENFHGNHLLYVGWEDHLMFCAPHCIAVAPGMRFATLAQEVIAAMYGMHPDWHAVRPESIEWFRSRERFTPDFNASLVENGLGHKALLRLRTPGLTGIGGSHS
ncbi:phenol hydroxylase subunit P4 [Paraburkholderia unamae]|jgi:phenol hydroxylase P4 protein|uniref:Phenol 2-monooxygenase P4 subunit n=1 Tax=Paraburkholderia unamae TaxID=219649 RepID=A0ABX5KR62_9BURK|nr:phenol hydroxylase subunit P4 [Paraburkholderia unamae]PVX85159.1 phenol 2-monooxygenase P4 subunit [Paraburkholderia unamae]CAG9252742.1 Phenol hydroxylase P4 protein [Paraburkholderia unamae]